MRRRVIEATISCLTDFGFAATTTQRVLEIAGVSRGAMLHHFPTRADLMIAAAEHCARAQNRHVARRLAPLEEGMQRFLALTEATWEATRSPTGVAFLEIMLGGRSEEGLDARLADVVRQLEDSQRRDVWRMAETLGMTDQEEEVEVMSRLHTAAMRGLVLEALCSPRAKSGDDCVRLLADYKRYITGKLLTDVETPLHPASKPADDV
jgi:AcrR family transcriptional regulator